MGALKGSALPKWVALLRNNSVTHGVDMSQRYVELALADEFQAVGTRRYQVSVQMPIDGYYAPPGYYMLVVVDTLNKPSHAVWIHLVQ